jgi:hypothetical protein
MFQQRWLTMMPAAAGNKGPHLLLLLLMMMMEGLMTPWPMLVLQHLPQLPTMSINKLTVTTRDKSPATAATTTASSSNNR